LPRLMVVRAASGDGLLALGPAHDDPCHRRAGDERQSFLSPDVMQTTSRLERICDPNASLLTARSMPNCGLE
jgi:hypothetical protein